MVRVVEMVISYSPVVHDGSLYTLSLVHLQVCSASSLLHLNNRVGPQRMYVTCTYTYDTHNTVEVGASQLAVA